MKNIFDLIKWEGKNLETETRLVVKERTLEAQWKAKELEKKNEIEEIKSFNEAEKKRFEISHNTEINALQLRHVTEIHEARTKHAEELSALREEMKTELGAKAIELEKQVAVLEKELSLKNTHIFELINDKRNLEKELQLMTNVALEASAKSAEVRIHDTKVVSPQVVEGKINVISTCGK